jgi:hypothetical protein
MTVLLPAAVGLQRATSVSLTGEFLPAIERGRAKTR